MLLPITHDMVREQKVCNSATTVHFVFNLDCKMKKGKIKFAFVHVLFLKLISDHQNDLERGHSTDVHNNFSCN